MRALLLTGQFGAGKTAVAIELSHQLGALGIRTAAVDLDWLAWVEPDLGGDALHELLGRNLRAIAANLAEAGVATLVLARALLGREHRAVVERALPGWELTVVRLLVADDQAVARVGRRDSGAELAGLLVDAAAVSEAVAAAGVEDLTVPNDGSRTIAEVAAEVLDQVGWR